MIVKHLIALCIASGFHDQGCERAHIRAFCSKQKSTACANLYGEEP